MNDAKKGSNGPAGSRSGKLHSEERDKLIIRQTTRAEWGAACKGYRLGLGEGGDGVRTGTGAVKRGGGRERKGACLPGA